MADAGCEKKPREFRRLLRATHLLLNPLVVIDRSFGCDELISPAVPQNHLASTVPERSQVRVIGSDYGAILLHRLLPETLVGGGCNRSPVQLRILREEVPEPIQRDAERLGFQRSPSAAPECIQVGSARQAVPQEAAVRPARALPKRSNDIHVGLGKGSTISGGRSDERRRVVVAALGIFDDTILH